MFRHSLSFKLVAGIILIELVMLSVLIWDNARSFRHTTLHQLEQTAKSISLQYAATAARFVYENDFARLSELSERLKNQFDIVYVSVLDTSGQPILTIGDSSLTGNTQKDLTHDDVVDGVLDIERTMTLESLNTGSVRIGFSLEMVEMAVAGAVWRGIVFSAAIVLLTIVMGALVGRRITADLRKLAAAAAEFGEGKTDIVLPDGLSDEVGVTAQAFRQMIEDREKAEDTIAISEKRLRDIADTIDDVVWINTPDFSQTLYINPAFEKIFGLTLEDLNNDQQSWTRSMDPEEAEKLHQTIADISGRVAAGDDAQISRFEYPVYSVTGPDGIDRKIYARSVAMRSSDGKIERFVGVATDVTELLVAQEDLRLSNENLAQAQKMEAVGQLTGGVAHDFNNLLAIILGNLELIEESSDPEEIREYLNAAMTATHRGAGLTKSLLSFARQSRLEPKTIDINQMVREVKSWSSRVIPENIDVEISLLAGLWRVRADPNLTQNAMLNLILNARDAMTNGGKMTIETANVRVDEEYNQLRGEEMEPGRYVMLAISDTGAGIAAEIVMQIFDPFFTTKPVGAGSGLGLSMVQGFMKQSGGTIRVYSEPDVGTTFKLYFKAISGKQDVSQSTETTIPPIQNSGARLLVVEDEEGVLDVLAIALTKAGYQVTVAHSGDQAMQIWGNGGRFDLLVTDIVMPGKLQGTQLARALRELDPELPVVFMSGYASEATVHGNGLRPEDIRLMKPVRLADLLASVEKALGKTYSKR